uniref:Microtubule-actin cross-linking factor 1 n=1 Tax=Talaromyces marneffei PM1 TaxID=1077442 RepID=A0A093VDV4_TALMA
MNRFRKGKKGKDVEETEAAPPSSFMGISKSKKGNKDAVKLELDLSTALPSTDNFRTSLLMPNLSARFSMLREQDDPTTKVGKANDDSVLFPKRASRLNLFGHNPNPLADIEEISSIDGRSSFATQRVNSYVSTEDGTDDDWQNGSVMNRKRPGEGNNLFGGRQKVYKIPVSGSGKDGGGMRGRTVYEDDINLSMFQKLRLKEREERRAMEAAEEVQDALAPESEEGLPAFLSKRMTSSSTTSGQSNPRTSTAATSIDEQPIGPTQPTSMMNNPSKPAGVISNNMNGHVSKTRRLYGQGLAQTAQDQQSSALTRLEGLGRQRAGGPPELPRLNRTFSRSATNLHDRRQGISPILPTPSSAARNYSPVNSMGSPLSEALDAVQRPDRTSDSSSTSPAYGAVPPLSPPISDNEEMTLAAALHPEDRGKATAMGLFNKPSGPYDEQQFMRRQLQMHENRTGTPTTRRSPANSVSQGETNDNRPRGLSNTSYRSKAESASSYYSGDGTRSRTQSVRDISPPRPNNGTFFLNLDNSDSESQSAGDDFQPLRKVSSVKSQAFDGIHPAFRSRPASRDSDGVPSTRESCEIPEVKEYDLNPIQETNPAPPSPILEEISEKAIDSPTLGPAGLGLNSMIRAHLRQDSAQSLLPLPSPRLPTHQDVSPPPMEPPSGPPPPPPTSAPPSIPLTAGFSSVALRAKQLREQAAALREQQQAEQVEGTHPPTQDEQSRLGHHRESSLETQKEREEFAHELAERRRRVQENLHKIDSRSNSPGPGRSTPEVGARTGNGFSLLKNRTAKNGVPDGLATPPSSKALKKIGIGGPIMNASTPSLDSWRDDEVAPGFSGLGKHSNSSSPQIASGRTASGRTAYSRSTSHGSEEPDSGSSRPASPTNYRRDRSTSASARSKTHAPYREDLDMVAEHSVSRYGDNPRVGRSPPSMRPSVDNENAPNERSASVTSGRMSGNRNRAPSQLELVPPQSDASSIGTSPRPSPVAPPYSANATPPLEEDRRDSPMFLNRSDLSNNTSAQSLPQRAPGGNGLPKRQVSKSQISEPTFVSSTSNVPMVPLPPGASLSNGMPNTPPIPPMNPRRRRTTATQTILGAIRGDLPQTPPAVGSSHDDERRTNYPPNINNMNNNYNINHQAAGPMESLPTLRKMHSESGPMNSRARQQAMMAVTPTMPNYPPATEIQGGMI